VKASIYPRLAGRRRGTPWAERERGGLPLGTQGLGECEGGERMVREEKVSLYAATRVLSDGQGYICMYVYLYIYIYIYIYIGIAMILHDSVSCSSTQQHAVARRITHKHARQRRWGKQQH
jgi:hypothetical protein